MGAKQLALPNLTGNKGPDLAGNVPGLGWKMFRTPLELWSEPNWKAPRTPLEISPDSTGNLSPSSPMLITTSETPEVLDCFTVLLFYSRITVIRRTSQ
jgi:hypothetical protein